MYGTARETIITMSTVWCLTSDSAFISCD